LGLEESATECVAMSTASALKLLSMRRSAGKSSPYTATGTALSANMPMLSWRQHVKSTPSPSSGATQSWRFGLRK